MAEIIIIAMLVKLWSVVTQSAMLCPSVRVQLRRPVVTSLYYAAASLTSCNLYNPALLEMPANSNGKPLHSNNFCVANGEVEFVEFARRLVRVVGCLCFLLSFFVLSSSLSFFMHCCWEVDRCVV